MFSKPIAEHINEAVATGRLGPPLDVGAFGAEIEAAINKQIERGVEARKREGNKLYFSEIGQPCARKLWYNHNAAESAIPLRAHERIKFMYGDMTESLILELAARSGLQVTDKQQRVELGLKNGWTLSGRIDCRINGTLVDVKSASSRSFLKFKDGTLEHDDPFGYKMQLGGYAAVMGDSKAEFLAFDKTLGHLCSYTLHDVPSRDTLITYCNALIDVITNNTPPPRYYDDVPEGKSGNNKLCMECSYCPHKESCWADANGGSGLATYLYSSGPVFLTKVVREPKVPKIIVMTEAE